MTPVEKKPGFSALKFTPLPSAKNNTFAIFMVVGFRASTQPT